MQSLAKHGILTFELVVVNLYPFETTVARKDVAPEEAIEQIDIGGPTMVRSGLEKPRRFTTIATSPSRNTPRFPTRRRPTAAPPLSFADAWPGEAFCPYSPIRSSDCRLLRRMTAEGAFPGTVTMS